MSKMISSCSRVLRSLVPFARPSISGSALCAPFGCHRSLSSLSWYSSLVWKANPVSTRLCQLPSPSCSAFHSPMRGFAAAPKSAKTDEGSAEKADPADAANEGEKSPAKDDARDRTRVIPWQVSVQYMKSEAYLKTYGEDPVWKPYRRQHKGLFPKRHTRRSCIKGGKIWCGSPCPMCRDEYLVLDYRHTDLLKQFISPFTGEILPTSTTNICCRKHARLRVEMAKAKHFGTMAFKVPFRKYDYEDYYGPSAPVAESNATPEENSPQNNDNSR